MALSALNIALGTYALLGFLKQIIQFGSPSHPARLTMYLASFCAAGYFGMQAAAALGIITPWQWLQWRPLPVVVGSMVLLLQSILLIGRFSVIQQKVVSRLPLIVGLLFLFFFPAKADLFFAAALMAATVFLLMQRGKARLQRRIFFKMVFFVALFGVIRLINIYWLYVLGDGLFFFVLFYFFQFQNAIGVSTLVDDFRDSPEGARG
jgi:hypothetical protein